MHGDERCRDTRVGEASRQPGVDSRLFRMVEQPAQHLDQHDLEQAVGEQPPAAPHLVGLGEQQIQRWREAVDVVDGHDDHAGQRADQGVFDAAREIECCAGHLRAVDRIEPMRRWAWVEQQGWLAERERAGKSTAGRVRHGQLSSAQEVQVPFGTHIPIGAREAERLGSQQMCRDAEVVEQTRQSIDGTQRLDSGRLGTQFGRNSSDHTPLRSKIGTAEPVARPPASVEDGDAPAPKEQP